MIMSSKEKEEEEGTALSSFERQRKKEKVYLPLLSPHVNDISIRVHYRISRAKDAFNFDQNRP